MKKLLVLMMVVVLSACSGEKDAVVKSGLNEEYVEDKQDYKYKASDLKTDKVEVVYVTSDSYGEVKNIEVETTLKAKEDGELKDVNVLNNVINTSGDEDHDVEDFTLDYTATIVSNGLFKEIKDDDLNKLSSSLNDLSDLNEKLMILRMLLKS
ncbi:MAG: hypothetical protein SO189_01350 [Erysipelotrichaceae bacterium]|nr:hypothetical protein [Erysipelotrichaceae bacterium]